MKLKREQKTWALILVLLLIVAALVALTISSDGPAGCAVSCQPIKK